MICSVTGSVTLLFVVVVAAEWCRASVASPALGVLERVQSLRNLLFPKEVIWLIEPHDVPWDLLSVKVPRCTAMKPVFVEGGRIF